MYHSRPEDATPTEGVGSKLPVSSLWWLGWIFAPRLLVAILATTAYWDTNPVLCVLAWIWALCFETGEKAKVTSQVVKGGKKS